MAEADLDVVIRQIAKAQTRSLIGAAKKRRDQYLARAAKATNKEPRRNSADRQEHHAAWHGHGEAVCRIRRTPAAVTARASEGGGRISGEEAGQGEGV